MKNEYGFLTLASSTRISINELVARDDEAGPFVWVSPADISDIEVPCILARNLLAREKPVLNLDDEDIFLEASVCSYLESCVRHTSDRSKISVDDVIGACVHIMVQWGSSLPAHSFYGDLDLLSPDNASRILKILRTVYSDLENEILRQNIRYFVGEHYQCSGVWILRGEPRFASSLDSEDLEFISMINAQESNL